MAAPSPRRTRSWRQAWDRALYGPDGFYRGGPGGAGGPAAHFRTSVHVGPVFHEAVARLLLDVDERLGHPAVLDLVDVGAGRGELLAGVLDALPADVAGRVRPLALEVRPAPPGLDPLIEWVIGAAPGSLRAARPAGARGLVVAHEWLDDLPCDVVEVDDAGTVRLVLVDDDGGEHPGPALTDAAGCEAYGVDAAAARDWLRRWWPLQLPGSRAEVGAPRDAALAGLAAGLAEGTLLAVDYGHVREQRSSGRFDAGTLVGYRDGRQVPPSVRGDTDITAHVAVDACLAAAAAEGGRVTLTTQREALGAVRLPDRAEAADPAAYATALERASQAAELRDPGGLGAFWWLRLDLPAPPPHAESVLIGADSASGRPISTDSAKEATWRTVTVRDARWPSVNQPKVGWVRTT